MPTLSEIRNDPNYVNANAETKAAIFDKWSASDPNYTSANDETKAAIREKFGISSGKPTLSSEQIQVHARKAAESVQIPPTLTEEFMASGPGRLIANVAAPGMAVMEAIPGKIGEFYKERTQQLKEMQERGGRGRQLPEQIASEIGGVAGTVIGLSPMTEALPIAEGAAGFVPKAIQYAKNIGVGATAGAGAGLLTPVGQTEDYIGAKGEQASMGALLGGSISAAFPPLAWLANKGWETARNLGAGAEGQAKTYLAEIFGDRSAREKVAKRVAELKPHVYGEQPTVGLAAVSDDVPIPALKAIEESARGRPVAAQELSARTASNEAARAKVLEAIMEPGKRAPAGFGEKVNLSRAEATRKNVTEKLYNAAKKDVVNVTDDMTTLLGGAEIQPAVARADKSLHQAVTNALVEGKSPPTGYMPGSTSIGHSLPEWSMGVRTPDTVVPKKTTIEVLQKVKNELDKDINALMNTTDAAGLTKLKQMQVARGQLDSMMRDQSKSWADAQDTFRFLSAPQNQADVAKVLYKALQSPAGVERTSSFGTAWREAPRTVKKGLDTPRFEEIGQVFSPDQMRQATGVARSMVQEGKYAALEARQGILPDVKNVLDKIESHTPGFLTPVVTAFRKVITRAGGNLDEQSQAIIDKLVAHPDKFTAFMRELTPAEKDMVQQGVRQAKLRLVVPAVVGSGLAQGDNK